METDTAFVRTDRVVVLNTVTHIGLNITFIIHPSHAELIYSIRNTQTFDQVYFIKLRVLSLIHIYRTPVGKTIYYGLSGKK